jgi:hypothetical protein
MPIAMFGLCQVGLITVAMVSLTALAIATEDHINHTQNFSPTSFTILHVDHLINPQLYDLFEDV